MKILKKLQKILYTLCIGYPLYAISFLFPRKKGRWVFGSGKIFSDNAKYLFLDVTENHPEIEAIWISQSKKTAEFLSSKGYVAYYRWSIKGLYYLLTANVYIVSNHLELSLPFWTIGRAKYIQLWHGVGIKNLLFKGSTAYYQKRLHHPIKKYLAKPFLLSIYKAPDIFLSTSKAMSEHFSECFRTPAENMVEAEYPRCSIFKWPEEELLKLVKKFETSEYLKIIKRLKRASKSYIYMPTWRDNNPNFLEHSGILLDELNQLMIEKNALFLFKLHPNTPSENLNKIMGYSNLIHLPNEADIYPLLPYTSGLITDYSSIYYDYLLLPNKEKILFTFDYIDYISRDRDLAYDYKDATAGRRVHNFTELLQTLKSEHHSATDSHKEEELKEFFWGTPEEKQDLIQAILKLEKQ